MSNKEERVASPAFKFKVGDLVLVKWEDGMVYFAKIKKIDEKRSKCVVIFDDKSQDDADFAQIHSGKFLQCGHLPALFYAYHSRGRMGSRLPVSV